MPNRKEIFCRRCKSKLGIADHDDFYLSGQVEPVLDRVILCLVCGWKRNWNFANDPKSNKKKFVNLDFRINKTLYGKKIVSESDRESFEESRRLDEELERRIEEQEEERRLERELERRIEMKGDED